MLGALTGVLIGGGDEAERIQEVVAVGDVDGTAYGFSYGLIFGERPAGYLPLPDSVASAQDNAASIPPESIPGVVDAPIATPIPQQTEVLPEPSVEPAATSVPVVSGGIEETICAYPWDCGFALSVARCESGPDLIAGYNSHGAAGTFQIMPVHAWRFTVRGWSFYDDSLIPERNIAVAFDLWSEQGWGPWACA